MIDLLETDPPYNIDYEGKTEEKLKIGNDHMEENNFLSFLKAAFGAANQHMKKGAAIYIWHAFLSVEQFMQAVKAMEWTPRQQLVWVKNVLVFGRQDYHWQHEPCIYGWKEGAGHYFIDDRKKTTVVKDRRPNPNKMSKEEMAQFIKDVCADKISTTIMHEDKPAASREHPTMKPVKLIARQIANSTREGENVLDLFGGSGTTLIACEQLGRTCYMMEYDPHYCDVIIDRYETFTGEKAEKING